MDKIPDVDSPIFFIKEQGSTYEGEFRNTLPDGKGVVHLRNGEYYAGDFKNGEACGYGIFIFRNGSLYFGDFENSVF